MVTLVKSNDLLSSDRLQYLVFIGLSIVVVMLTGIGYFSNHLLFQRFLSGINPLLAILFISLMGIIFLSFLLSQGWFAVYKKESLKGLARCSGLAALFGLVAILVDSTVVFPADLNISFPASLVFYPVMGFIAELLFHVMPLSLIFLILILLSKKITNQIVWISILVVSCLEPIYQTIASFSEPVPLWATVWVGLHVYLINLSQLIIFTRYDFVSMYLFRLVYYLIWHVVWGYFRLKLMF
ncbi:MAG TPA: hypothetical protein VFZ34_29490 [Blastocatellia bacterium]|nr:hypothetical protein [Blastocatellia bacterium]